MKNLFIIVLLLSTSFLYAQKTSVNKTIGKTYKIKNYKARYPENTFINIEMAEHDFPNGMNWYDANAACRNLGPGWRLPTVNEMRTLKIYRELETMKYIFENMKKADYILKTFPDLNAYWCDTVGISKKISFNDTNDSLIIQLRQSKYAYMTNMRSGTDDVCYKTEIKKVRAVRSL
jgi:hypothetical protein